MVKSILAYVASKLSVFNFSTIISLNPVKTPSSILKPEFIILICELNVSSVVPCWDIILPCWLIKLPCCSIRLSCCVIVFPWAITVLLILSISSPIWVILLPICSIVLFCWFMVFSNCWILLFCCSIVLSYCNMVF